MWLGSYDGLAAALLIHTWVDVWVVQEIVPLGEQLNAVQSVETESKQCRLFRQG